MPSHNTKIYHTSSSEETKRLGEEFAAALCAAGPSFKGATVIALVGDLGAGKTTFIQGFLCAAGVHRRAPSPTFVIMRHYKVSPGKRREKRGFAHVHHMDAYRLKDASQLGALGFDVLLNDPANILLIEWGERIKDALPQGFGRIAFDYGKKEGTRTIAIAMPSARGRARPSL